MNVAECKINIRQTNKNIIIMKEQQKITKVAIDCFTSLMIHPIGISLQASKTDYFKA